MAKEKFERNILLPLIEDFENKRKGENLYDLYFTLIADEIGFSNNDKRKRALIYTRSFTRNENSVGFIERFHKCFFTDAINKEDEKDAEKELDTFLIENRHYESDGRISVANVINDIEVYELVKKTWIGRVINSLVNTKEKLKDKLEKQELDLLDFAYLIPEKH